MKCIYFYLLLFFSTLTFSQKNIERIITVDSAITSVFIDLNNVFTINLKTAKTNTIKIKAKSEGEYANHFILAENILDNSINITGRIAFTFPNNQDKLSAHKVHAIVVDIIVPENLHVNIKSDIGNLVATGDYKQLKTDFISGNCYLEAIAGVITIKTIKGDINLITKSGSVEAFSRTGSINKEELAEGSSKFILKTAKGNINIQQSK